MINSSMFGDFYLYNSLNTEERFYRSIPMSAENIHTTKFIQLKKLFCRYFFPLVLYASPHVRESEFREFSHIETGTFLSIALLKSGTACRTTLLPYK